VRVSGVSAQRGSDPIRGTGSAIEWASVLAALPEPLFIMEAVRDPGGTVVELTYAFVNEAAARLYGKSVDEVVGHGQCELFPSVKELGIWDSYLGVVESGAPTSFDVPFFNENGVEGSFRLTATKVRDGLLISATDTTEQVKAEKALEADRSVLRATVDSLLDPAVRFGAVRDESGVIIDFVFTDANPAACAYDQTTREELIGTRLLDIFPGIAATGLIEKYVQVLETGEPLALDEYAYPLGLIGEQQRYLDIRVALVDGGIASTWRDVTERRQAKQDLEARLQELQQFQRVTVGRELKMIELKKEIEYLKKHGSAGG
jgi:PAS domain-containing protein